MKFPTRHVRGFDIRCNRPMERVQVITGPDTFSVFIEDSSDAELRMRKLDELAEQIKDTGCRPPENDVRRLPVIENCLVTYGTLEVEP